MTEMKINRQEIYNKVFSDNPPLRGAKKEDDLVTKLITTGIMETNREETYNRVFSNNPPKNLPKKEDNSITKLITKVTNVVKNLYAQFLSNTALFAPQRSKPL